MLNPLELQRYLKTCAKRGNVNVVYEDKYLPRTDGNTVWIPRPTMFTTEKEAAQLTLAGHMVYDEVVIIGRLGKPSARCVAGVVDVQPTQTLVNEMAVI